MFSYGEVDVEPVLFAIDDSSEKRVLHIAIAKGVGVKLLWLAVCPL